MIAIEVQIVGERQLQAAFVQVEQLVDDLSPIFEEVGEEALSDIQQRIANHPGPPLAPSTIRRKGHARILRDKDDLYASFQKGAPGNVARVRPTEADFGTSDFKAQFHQEGTARMPKRTVIEVTGEQEAKYGRIAGDALAKRLREIGFEVT